MIKTLWFRLGAACPYFPLVIWPGRGLPVRSFPSFLPWCWFGGHEIDQVGVMIQWVMSNPRIFLRQLFGKNVSTGIRCHSERIMSISFIGMSASLWLGHKACYVGGSKIRWTQWWIPCISWISLLETVATSLFHWFSQSFRMSRCILTSKIRVE